MSGVFVNRLPRKYSRISVSVSSPRYCRSSQADSRHVKYV